MGSDELTITLLFVIEGIIKSYINILNSAFQGFEKLKYQGIGNTILNLILFIFIILTVYADFGIFGISISYILANIIALIYEYYVLRKYIARKLF